MRLAHAVTPPSLDGATCAQLPLQLRELFFPAQPREDERILLWEAACAGCPVRVRCFDHAVANEQHGIWAGTSEVDRRRLQEDPELLEFARNRLQAGYLPLPRRKDVVR